MGTPATLEIATWNVEHFGSTSSGPSNEARQFDHVLQTIRASGIDVWGLQEVRDRSTFRRLLDSLGTGYDGRLADVGDASYYTGFVFRTDVLTNVQNADQIFTDDDYDFAGRPPLQMTADVTLPDTALTMTFITVHMKAFSDNSSYERREDAARRLKTRIDFSSLDSEPVVILGDFNDELTGSIASGQPSPYANFLDDTEGYLFTTLPLDEEGAFTFCGNGPCTDGSTIDHILITDELFEPFVESSTARMATLLDVFSGYVYNTSDHLPVYALFDFHTGTAIDAERPQRLVVQRPFPNPFREDATLRYALDQPTDVRIDVFDALGRHVRTLQDGPASADRHTVHLRAGDLPAGLYLVRFEAAGERRTFPVVLAR